MRKAIAAGALLFGLGTANAASQTPPVISIEAGRSDHLLRDDSDTAAFTLDLNGWTVGLAYAKESPELQLEKERYSLNLAKEFTNQRFSATLRERTSDFGKDERGAHVAWSYGQPGKRRFGLEGAFTDREFEDFLIEKANQGHARVFYQTPKGIEFSVFGNRQATADLLQGSGGFVALPRSSLLGRQTMADTGIGEDVVENSLGGSIKFNDTKKSFGVYAKQGEQYLRGVGEADEFQAYGLNANAQGKNLFGNVEVDIRSAKNPVEKYHEARVLLDGGVRASRFEFGMGAYGHGLSTELDDRLLTDFSQTAGGAIQTAARFGQKTWLGVWGMIEDDAAESHTVMRGGPFARFGEYEIGLGVRRDRLGMARFRSETNGQFLTFKSPFGSGLIGKQEEEFYGNLKLSIGPRNEKTDAKPSAFLGDDRAQTPSFLPNASRYAENPFLGSRVDVAWRSGAHSGKLFTRRSLLNDTEGDDRLNASEFGGSYRLSTDRFQADVSASLREIPSIGFQEPVGHAAVLYRIDTQWLGAGWLRDYPDFTQSRDAPFLFLRTPIGKELLLENAIGTQQGNAFTSFMISLPLGRPTQQDLLPRHLLPPVPINAGAVVSAPRGTLDLPGPENFIINVHNCDGCGSQQLPYLEAHREAYTGVRIGPAVFSACREGDSIASCTYLPPKSDEFIDGVLNLFGDNNIFLVDWNLGDRPQTRIPQEELYQMVTSLLRYDDRVRLVQCGGESKSSANQSVQEYFEHYLKTCRRAIDDVNRERPEHRKAFLLDAAPFGTNIGPTQKWRAYTQTGAWDMVDALTCHIYTRDAAAAIRIAKECKAVARNKPLMFTETNAIVQQDNALVLGGMSAYDKHPWWITDVMPVLEQIALEGVSPDQRWMVKTTFYTLSAHEGGEYNLIRFRNPFDATTWEPTGPAHDIITQRQRMASGTRANEQPTNARYQASTAPSPVTDEQPVVQHVPARKRHVRPKMDRE